MRKAPFILAKGHDIKSSKPNESSALQCSLKVLKPASRHNTLQLDITGSAPRKTGNLTEPGHMMEWCWLLYWYGRLSGVNVQPEAEQLYKVGVAIGSNPKTSLLYNETDIHGKVTKADSRLWCQTEYIKANIARASAGHAEAAQAAADMIDLMFTHYLDVPKIGGWHDERNADEVSKAL